MATKPTVAAKPEAEEAPAPAPVKARPNRKKLLILGGVVILVLALAGGAASIFLRKAATSEELAEAPPPVEHRQRPIYLPLENMVVNLADPGGDKVAQVGITLELTDEKKVEDVKQYLPTIRNDILKLISQRTAEEMLKIEGKEKLAADILLVASQPFVVPGAAVAKSKKKAGGKNAGDDSPVRAVLFSSFIVQ